MAKKRTSIEPEVEQRANELLKSNGVNCTDKNKSINDDIESALSSALSKQGGTGGNKPDIQFLAEVSYKRLPVMIEAKGVEGKLIKLSTDGSVEQIIVKKDGSQSYTTVNGYAVNGAVHYAKAIIKYTKTWKDCLAVGINGYDDATGRHFEEAIYYVSEDNFSAPIFISNDMKLLYKEANGLVIKDNITLNGDDWLFTQHQKVDIKPTEKDFKNTVAEFLSWQVSQFMIRSI